MARWACSRAPPCLGRRRFRNCLWPHRPDSRPAACSCPTLGVSSGHKEVIGGTGEYRESSGARRALEAPAVARQLCAPVAQQRRVARYASASLSNVPAVAAPRAAGHKSPPRRRRRTRHAGGRPLPVGEGHAVGGAHLPGLCAHDSRARDAALSPRVEEAFGARGVAAARRGVRAVAAKTRAGRARRVCGAVARRRSGPCRAHGGRAWRTRAATVVCSCKKVSSVFPNASAQEKTIENLERMSARSRCPTSRTRRAAAGCSR